MRNKEAMSDMAFYIVDGIFLDEFGDSYQAEGEGGERRRPGGGEPYRRE